ncbi:parvalbumin, thymic-like [Rhinoraja longicauda]
MKCCLKKASPIIKDTHHLGCALFSLLPLGRSLKFHTISMFIPCFAKTGIHRSPAEQHLLLSHHFKHGTSQPRSFHLLSLSPEEEEGHSSFTMKITEILRAGDISKAIEQCKESFTFKKFFETSGLSSKSNDEVKEVFAILDQDGSSYIDKSELKSFLKYFSPDARMLSDREAESMVSAVDNDGDGKIKYQEFLQLVLLSRNPEAKN